MTTSLQQAWKLWEKAEKGWESATPAKKREEVHTAPKGEKKDKPFERSQVTAQKETPSELNSLESEKDFVPGNDKDAKITQLKTELDRLEESLMELELSEAFTTPDVGTSIVGQSLFMGAPMDAPNGYDRNFCADPQAPEEMGSGMHQDSTNSLVAPRTFMPREELAALQEALEHNRRTRMSKLY